MKVDIVKSIDFMADWTAVYLDGRKIFDDMEISNENLLNLLGIKCEVHTADEDWVMELDDGPFPDKLEDVVLQ